MKRAIFNLILVYSCCVEYSLEAGKIKVNVDNNYVLHYQQLTCKEKYSCIMVQHGVAAQVALKNHLRAIDALKAEAEEKRLS